jgi:uncharacterized membrane protein (DUF485 family)
MPLSSDVTLRKDAVPKFPDRCVVCLESAGGRSLKIAESSINGLITLYFPFLWLLGFRKIAVPVCDGCTWRFLRQRWSRTVFAWVLVVVAVFLVAPHFDELSRFLRRLVVGGVVLVLAMPYILFETFFPRFFGVSVKANCVDYEFASAEYARQFKSANAADVLRSGDRDD